MQRKFPGFRRTAANTAVLTLAGVATLVGATTFLNPGSAPVAATAHATEYAQSMQTSGAVISRYRDTHRLTTAAGQQVEIGRVNLPAGNYTIFAKMYPTVPLPSGYKKTIRCVLSAGGDFDQTVVEHDGMIASVPITLNVVHTFPAAGPAILSCGYDYVAGDTYLRFIKVTAIPANQLSNAPL